MHVQDFCRGRKNSSGPMEKLMQKTSLIAALVLGAAFAASPALAKTSVVKSSQICEDAAKSQTPAPKSVRTDKDETRSNDDTVTLTLRVKNADDSSAKLICVVDRNTSTPTLKAAP